jgi:hypothetical protein
MCNVDSSRKIALDQASPTKTIQKQAQLKAPGMGFWHEFTGNSTWKIKQFLRASTGSSSDA